MRAPSGFAERLRRAELRAREMFARWLLRDVRLPSLRVGQNTITLTPADNITWSGSSTPTALGQLGMDGSTGRARAFVAGGSTPLLTQKDAANLTLASLSFYFSANMVVIGTSSPAWILTSSPSSFGVSAKEYLFGGLGIHPTEVVLDVVPILNTANPGTVTLTVTKNGASTLAAFAFVNGDTGAAQAADTFTFSSTDTWGLKIETTTTTGSFEATATVRLQGGASLA